MSSGALKDALRDSGMSDASGIRANQSRRLIPLGSLSIAGPAMYFPAKLFLHNNITELQKGADDKAVLTLEADLQHSRYSPTR